MHQKEAPALRIALEAGPPNADAGLIVAPEKFLNHDTGLIFERAGHRGDRAQFAVLERHQIRPSRNLTHLFRRRLRALLGERAAAPHRHFPETSPIAAELDVDACRVATTDLDEPLGPLVPDEGHPKNVAPGRDPRNAEASAVPDRIPQPRLSRSGGGIVGISKNDVRPRRRARRDTDGPHHGARPNVLGKRRLRRDPAEGKPPKHEGKGQREFPERSGGVETKTTDEPGDETARCHFGGSFFFQNGASSYLD